MTSTTKPTADQIAILSEMTTRDHAGLHFYDRFDDADLAALESAGLIEITRPIHDATGLEYGRESHRVEITPEGLALIAD